MHPAPSPKAASTESARNAAPAGTARDAAGERASATASAEGARDAAPARGAPVVAVLGAGVAGLVAAQCLRRAGCAPVVFERAPHAGGRAAATTREGFRLDSGAHLVSARDQRLAAWLHALAPDALPLRPVQHAQAHRGRVLPIAPEGARGVRRVPGVRWLHGLRTLRLPRLMLRMRAGLVPAQPQAAAPFDDRSVADFARLYFGESALAAWIEPWLAAETGADASASSRALFLRHYEARAFAPSGTLRGGLARLITALSEGLDLRLGVTVQSVEAQGARFRVHFAPERDAATATSRDAATPPQREDLASRDEAARAPMTQAPRRENPASHFKDTAARGAEEQAPRLKDTAAQDAADITRASQAAPSRDATGVARLEDSSSRGAAMAGEVFEADAVISALPAPAACACLAPVLAAVECDVLAASRAAPALVAHFALDAAPAPVATRVRVPLREASPAALLAVEPGPAPDAAPDAQLPSLAPPGTALATVMARAPWSRAQWDAPDAAIRRALWDALARCFPSPAPRFAVLQRHAAAFPHFEVGRYRALARLARVGADRRAQGRRVYLAGDWLIAPSLEGAIQSAERAAAECLQDFGLTLS